MDMEQESKAELLARLDVMEAMMQEGRKFTDKHGWAFVLWGVAYLVAIGWTAETGQGNLAWPVTMIAAGILSGVIGSLRARHHPRTRTANAIGAIWIAVSISMFVYLFSVGMSGHFEPHTFVGAVEALLGIANGASAIILRWRTQFLVALLWWASAMATCFVAVTLVIPIEIVAVLIGQLGFGLYLMYCERRDRRSAATAVQHG